VSSNGTDASGTQEDRPQYRTLLATARKRQINVVLVWRYDRFARSTQALVHALNEFHRLGVDCISDQEHIDTTTPQGEMVFTVMASLAQFASALISERVKAGMARAKAQGKRISQAPIARMVQQRIAALHVQGLSIHQMSRQLKIGYGTAWNDVQRYKHMPSSRAPGSEQTCGAGDTREGKDRCHTGDSGSP
jgi:DNA invertase Pin-like site-specific DNA recombinase